MGMTSFREVLEKMLVIVVLPVRKTLRKEVELFSPHLVSNTCGLLASIVSELTASAMGSEAQTEHPGDSAHSHRWTSLELVKGTYSTDDSPSDISEIRLDKAEGVKYAVRLRNYGSRTANGDGGMTTVQCSDGVSFTFSTCSLSSNGTNQTRGQIPQILYYSYSAKPMRRTRTAAELCLWSVLWSELRRTSSTGHLQLMPEDALRLLIPSRTLHLSNLGGKSLIHDTINTWTELRKFSGSTGWPTTVLVLPGWSTVCLATGWVFWLVAILYSVIPCVKALILVSTCFSQVCKTHSGILGKGLALSHSPTILEALEGTLPLHIQTNEHSFLEDFITCVPNSSGGRLASPLTDSSHNRPSENMLIRANTDGTYSANWTPGAVGLYTIHVTIDGIEIGIPPPLPPLGVRKFVSKDSAGLRVRSHPSLQSEQIGIVHVNGTITFIDEIHNDDGIWLRLNDETVKKYVPNMNGYTEAWCLSFNQHLGRNLLVPADVSRRRPAE
ncbi:hypothetical protein GOODEAATRI_007970, partial [Goodea atripinnis]